MTGITRATTITLTTDHAVSSYGVPVAVIDGKAYGPIEPTPYGVTAGDLVREMCESWNATEPLGAEDDQTWQEKAKDAFAIWMSGACTRAKITDKRQRLCLQGELQALFEHGFDELFWPSDKAPAE